MSDENSMHDAIKNFILERKEKKEENLLTSKFNKDKDGGLNKILIQELQSSDECADEDLKKITDKKKGKENSSAFHYQKHLDLIDLAEASNVDVAEYKEIYKQQKQEISAEHRFPTWLDENLQYTEEVSVATHVSKLTHPSNRASCFFDSIQEKKTGYMGTSCLRKPTVDGAYESAKYSPTVSLLLVEHEGRYFYEDVIDGNVVGLEGFEENAEQLNNWKSQLKKSIDKTNKSTGPLSKQVYFPIKNQPSESDDWHLLSILVSSSLAQEIFKQTGAKEFNDKNKSIRDKFRSKSRYTREILITYPEKATLMVTQSSHQNTSKLNGQRSGRLFLLSTQPQIWQSQLKPPVHNSSLFYSRFFSPRTQENIDYLRDFLLRFEHLDLSIRGPERRKRIDRWVDNIIDELLDYAASIQNLPPGWSDAEDIKLKSAHQYFLDPYRDDETFQAERKATDWQAIVCADFARWLNSRLQGRDKQFTPQAQHTRMWKKRLEAPLREYNEAIEANQPYESGGMT